MAKSSRPAKRKNDGIRLEVYPAGPSRWRDLETLLGERGGCGGCWCMVWRLPPSVWRGGKGAKNRRALKRIVTAGDPPGVLGYLKGKPVAWCAVAPRKSYSFLERSRVLRPVDDLPVWSISCLFVEKTQRRRGLSAKLLRAAVEFAGRHGARFVEGYPTIPYAEKAPDPFLWTGTLSAFREAGFVEVARRSKGRPILRCECAPRREGRSARGESRRGAGHRQKQTGEGTGKASRPTETT